MPASCSPGLLIQPATKMIAVAIPSAVKARKQAEKRFFMILGGEFTPSQRMSESSLQTTNPKK
jgi:hypothetical protein